MEQVIPDRYGEPMALARYKDLCIDAAEGDALGRFWATALGLTFEPDDAAGTLVGDTSEQRVWMNLVPERKTVKHRVHLDVHCESVESLVALGARILDSGSHPWTVMADPEDGEFCAFVRSEVPDYRLYEINVDCHEPRAVAGWWSDVLGAGLGADEGEDCWWLEDVPGLPFQSWVFASVPEPKKVKNRIHWDVTTAAVQPLVDAGATVQRPPTEQDAWYIMTDPEGNEFCAFVQP